MTILAQIEKLAGWLGSREGARQKLLQSVAVIRSALAEEARAEARLHAAYVHLQQYVVRVRSGAIRKLLKAQIAALCRLRDVSVAWQTGRSEHPNT